jgi:hypothetical protein
MHWIQYTVRDITVANLSQARATLTKSVTLTVNTLTSVMRSEVMPMKLLERPLWWQSRSSQPVFSIHRYDRFWHRLCEKSDFCQVVEICSGKLVHLAVIVRCAD